jgi:hypothetical protein
MGCAEHTDAAQAMIAGGIGGTSGDILMHSLDTVKTRQQGDPHIPPKYTNMSSTYSTIFRQEGFRRGLYSGVTPAILGSFPGTIIFFGTYEYSKRHLIDFGVRQPLAYLASGRLGHALKCSKLYLSSLGFIADLAASIVYVPSEVLKTRLQLQGRYNNPFFSSGYNYRSTLDAARTIVRTEGFAALFYGYKATIFRDLPFSAIQFALYEQEQKWAKQWVGSRDIGLGLEILTGATAGGMAGILTCPLDVVKTRIQTQINPNHSMAPVPVPVPSKATNLRKTPASMAPTTKEMPRGDATQRRHISTSSPNTSIRKPGSINLDTSSVIEGLKIIYRTEGLGGWFRGVGPRAVWTSVQSGTMLVLYQAILRRLEEHPVASEDGPAIA